MIFLIKDIDEFIDVKMVEGIYELKLRFPNIDSIHPLISTNLKSVVDFVTSYLKLKLDDYIQLESIIGNMGMLTLSEHVSMLMELILRVLSYKKINGIYFEVSADFKTFNMEEQTEESYKPFIDTRDGDAHPNEFYFFLDSLFMMLFETISIIIDDFDKIDAVCNNLFDNIFIDNLNDLYTGKISIDDFSSYLDNENKEMKKSKLMN